MKKYTNQLKINSGRSIGSQEPIDDRVVWATVAELQSAITDGSIAKWYFGMPVYIGELNKWYVWCDTATAVSNANIDATTAILSPGATYPSIYSIEYAGKTFNFYSFAIPDHNHDSLYYTQAQITAFLAAKAALSHTHTESQISDLDKYSKDEIDTFLANKADETHTHSIADVDTLGTELSNRPVKTDLIFNNGNSTTLLFDRYGFGRTYFTPLAPTNASALTIDVTGIVAGAKAYVFSNRVASPSITGSSCQISIYNGLYKSNSLNLIEIVYLGLFTGTHYFAVNYITAFQALSVQDNQLSYDPSTNVLGLNKTPLNLTVPGSALTWELNTGVNAYVNLSQNSTLTITYVETGDTGRLIVAQDATGNRTLTVQGPTTSERHFQPGGTGGSTLVLDLSTAPSSVDLLEFYFDGAFFYWKSTKGFA